MPAPNLTEDFVEPITERKSKVEVMPSILRTSSGKYYGEVILNVTPMPKKLKNALARTDIFSHVENQSPFFQEEHSKATVLKSNITKWMARQRKLYPHLDVQFHPTDDPSNLFRSSR